MPSSELYVAIYCNDSGIYKHWALFVDGPTDEEKLVFNILGSSTQYRFEMEESNAFLDPTLIEVFPLCDVDSSKIDAIKDAAQNAVIHNESPGYNCQDYVLELLDDLEAKGIISRNDVEYAKNKQGVKDKQEGLA
ncbi:hypothetical protein N7474_010840 [Penicillium riverlandense]|uniref:uncharacterized protein n=1 Tax=Penicillium riverlandense TaxID=1903569 RepID=UPI002546C4CE|nr:uncharacterized protein N7474_010840 [Penicillium riverlandense]KAJ5804953.1 hypothetical protein N7474_010840 [Penicillium riverlandense]